MTAAWLTFWDGSHPIYVSARHKDVHYRLLAEAIARLVPGPAARVLDYGCGEALHADKLAAAVGELVLCDGAPRRRGAIAARFADCPKIRVVSPAELDGLAERSFDLIVMHSVAQYLSAADTGALFRIFRRLLRPDGALTVSDVIPPAVTALTDALSLLRFGAANGFLAAALHGLVRTRLSDYWRLRRHLGLTRYGETAMLETLGLAGFAGRRMAENIGHNQARMAFIARPAGY